MKQKILEHYTHIVLEQENDPISVYRFCKNLKIGENEFYNHFASLEDLRRKIFSEFS